ncbi:50S ribosomal protein L34e [Candidatus Woesearchaeota archaeon]|nr:50S ribosomal protein L34e [Candidatus Woesearchaeota archaeon]
MVAPNRRSRTLRRVQRKTPGGVTRQKYVKRKPRQAKCSGCGAYLPGTPRVRATKLHTISMSEKRPKRPFGGELCSKCTRLEMIKRARMVK